MIKSIFLTLLLAGFWGASGKAQTRIPVDSSGLALNMDAAYNRPFLQMGKIPVALGGYAEMKAAFNQTDGISEGFSFQMQRLTLFVSSSIHPKIKFLAEIEFEEGAKAINLEFASIDTRSFGVTW